MNMTQKIAALSELYANRPVFRFEDQSYDFDSIMLQVARCAGMLSEKGVKQGDRVVLIAKNCPEWIVSMLATLKIGAVIVPINPALTANEVGYIIAHAEPSLIIADLDLADLLVETQAATDIVFLSRNITFQDAWETLLKQAPPFIDCVELPENQLAAIFYTSGTTGRPKGVMQSHASLWATAHITAQTFNLSAADISLIPNSLSFIYPMVINALGCISVGASVVLQERFHPELAMRAIEKNHVTVMMGVPTMFGMMLNWAEGKLCDVSSIRLGVSAGSSLSWAMVLRFKKVFNAPLYDLWGQTEGTPITSFNIQKYPEGIPESCGHALAGCSIRIINTEGAIANANDVGEVLLQGPNMMLGYYKNTEASNETIRAGWIYTGDLGRIDAKGHLYIVGRKRDMIIRGGSNIYPVEIEEIIYRHTDVLECAVIGVPDPLFGEQVKALIVLKDLQPVTQEDILELCQRYLAPYKVPKIIEFVDQLPKGPTGKILKRLLQ